ncbi:MAG: hypothetical protein LC109_13245 [Bacteroidia bacterium]|nr:hypothetical protein [Bacteroidia bacterium]
MRSKHSRDSCAHFLNHAVKLVGLLLGFLHVFAKRAVQQVYHVFKAHLAHIFFYLVIYFFCIFVAFQAAKPLRVQQVR